jgi:hypothetical protein
LAPSSDKPPPAVVFLSINVFQLGMAACVG